jgi:hypothetical protein
MQGLRIVHYSLEHDHVHLYAEASDNKTLAKGMKALGGSLVKKIHRHLGTKGSFYKTRYHLRILRSAMEVKHVLNYILKNGIKHKRTTSIIDPYNSAATLHDFKILGLRETQADEISRQSNTLKMVLDELLIYRRELYFV